MCNKACEDKIGNERIRWYYTIASINGKFKERWVAWYGHIMRRLSTMPRRCVDIYTSACVAE